MSEPQSPQPRNRSRSSPAPIVGRGQSSAAILPLPRNTAAFTPALSFAAISPLANVRPFQRSARPADGLTSHRHARDGSDRTAPIISPPALTSAGTARTPPIYSTFASPADRTAPVGSPGPRPS